METPVANLGHVLLKLPVVWNFQVQKNIDTVPSVAQIIGHSPKKKLHLSNQYKIWVPTKIMMRFFGGVFPIVPIGWWVFHRIFCCQASEFGTFWFRTAPHDRSDASGHAGLGGFRKFFQVSGVR